jgi:hypothetical protein
MTERLAEKLTADVPQVPDFDKEKSNLKIRFGSSGFTFRATSQGDSRKTMTLPHLTFTNASNILGRFVSGAPVLLDLAATYGADQIVGPFTENQLVEIGLTLDRPPAQAIRS